jgi:hypothetical protein
MLLVLAQLNTRLGVLKVGRWHEAGPNKSSTCPFIESLTLSISWPLVLQAGAESQASDSRRSSALSVSTSLTRVGLEEAGGIIGRQCSAPNAIVEEGGATDPSLPLVQLVSVDAAAACGALVTVMGEGNVGVGGSGRETPVHVSSGGAGPDEALPQEEVMAHRHEAALQQADHEPQDKGLEALGGSVAGGVTGAGSVEAAATGAVVDIQVSEGTASASTSECKVRRNTHEIWP